jgi:hypothetical protein
VSGTDPKGKTIKYTAVYYTICCRSLIATGMLFRFDSRRNAFADSVVRRMELSRSRVNHI